MQTDLNPVRIRPTRENKLNVGIGTIDLIRYFYPELNEMSAALLLGLHCNLVVRLRVMYSVVYVRVCVCLNVSLQSIG